MKYCTLFKQYLKCSDSEEVFKYLIDNLAESITSYDYFVNWKKIFDSYSELEMDLNTMNYLIGKGNITEEFKKLLKINPGLVKLIPVLIGVRDNKFTILDDFNNGNLKYKNFAFIKHHV